MNQDYMLKNMNYIYELEEKDYLKFLHKIGERNAEEYFGKVPFDEENFKRFPKEREEVGNKIYLSLLSYCLSALKFLQDNSGKYFEHDKTVVILKKKNKLTRFIDVLEGYIFIDHVTHVYNERWFNKTIYNEMDLVMKTNTPIVLISLQLEYNNNIPSTKDSKKEKECNLEKEIYRQKDTNLEKKTYLYKDTYHDKESEIDNVKTFVTIAKKILNNEKEELFRMNTNEFLIVSKEQETDRINTRIEYILEEVIKSIKNVYLYFGITRITREELLEDFNIITYLKNVDQEVNQYRRNYLKKVK